MTPNVPSLKPMSFHHFVLALSLLVGLFGIVLSVEMDMQRREIREATVEALKESLNYGSVQVYCEVSSSRPSLELTSDLEDELWLFGCRVGYGIGWDKIVEKLEEAGL